MFARVPTLHLPILHISAGLAYLLVATATAEASLLVAADVVGRSSWSAHRVHSADIETGLHLLRPITFVS